MAKKRRDRVSPEDVKEARAFFKSLESEESQTEQQAPVSSDDEREVADTSPSEVEEFLGKKAPEKVDPTAVIINPRVGRTEQHSPTVAASQPDATPVSKEDTDPEQPLAEKVAPARMPAALQHAHATKAVKAPFTQDLRSDLALLQVSLLAEESPVRNGILKIDAARMAKSIESSEAYIAQHGAQVSDAGKKLLSATRHNLSVIHNATDDEKVNIYSALRSAVRSLENGVQAIQSREQGALRQ